MAASTTLPFEKIWVTGAEGLIGGYLLKKAPKVMTSGGLIGLTRSELDLTEADRVERRFALDRPDLVIHCAALSSSAACQQDPRKARQVNVEVPRLLSRLCADIPMVFFSTDLVFDGSQGNYVESDIPRPLTVYGETKLEAESIILANPRHLVMRISLNGGISKAGNRAFNEQLCLNWKQGRTTPLFRDEFRNPIPAAVTARVVWHLVMQQTTGLFHLAGAEKLSRVDMGYVLARRWPELKPLWEARSLEDYQGPPRSPDTTMNCAKVQALLPFPLPGLSEWLSRHPEEPF